MNTKVYWKMPSYSGGSFGSKSKSSSSHGSFSRGGIGGGHSGVTRGGYKGTSHTSRGGFGRGVNRGGGRRGPADQKINPALFVNKAIVTETTEKFVPEHSFNDFLIDARIKANIAKHGFTMPTPI